ncbi:MAG: outer membrane beta-barrel protein [Bacteroidales bacterium]|nr:outer membrane beta-barrel protein [Bacteroidales bacterium]
MKKFFSLITLLGVMVPALVAQSKFDVKGTIIDKETKEALMGANIQVLSLPDSTLVTGAMADEMGAFSMQNVKKANYLLKVSFMGYVSRYLPLQLKQHKGGRKVDLGYLTLTSDSKMLQEAIVTTTVAKVQVSGDSIQFNPSAYRVPQGSTLEALVKLLPGAEVDEEGNITINGKSVNKILVDGKEFFLNDKSVAMKNIPVDIIDKIKTYDRKSDMARITGVDDGEEETVLDLSVKKGMKNGWFGNALAGLGNEHRYSMRGMGNYFNDNTNVSVVGNGYNVPGNPRWNRGGLNSHKEAGINFASRNTQMETGGSVSYRYDGSDNQSRTNAAYYTYNEYQRSRNSNFGSNHSVDAQFKMEWRPDTMTTILFRPNFSYRRNNAMGRSSSNAFNTDISEMSDEEIEEIIEQAISIDQNQSQNHNNSTQSSGNIQVTRRLHKPGRNVTLRLAGDYNQSESQNISHSYVRYKNTKQDIHNNRYYDTPARSYGASAQVVWSEPIGKGLHFNVSYRYQYSYSKNDRQAFVYDDEAYADLKNALLNCRYDVDEVLRLMREAQYMMRDTLELSQFSEYRNYNQRIGLQIRKVHDKYNFSAGVDAFPQRTTLNYRYMGKEYPEISRNVLNVTPRVNLRVNFNKTTNLHMRYNGRVSQPSMTDLLDIVDDSNPKYVRKGNPHLKPSFSHNWNGNFNTYYPENQRGVWSWLYGGLTRNSISNKTTYDTITTIRTTMPKNINGNWNIGTGVGMNLGLGKEKHFSIGGNIGGNFNQNVGLYNNISSGDADDIDIKSITQTLRFNTGANVAYRNDYISIELRGTFNETHASNNINSAADRDTQDFRYGSDMKFTMPWGTELASDVYMTSRRGYSQRDMNTDEMLWNASISHSFLKGNALTIKGEIYDILGQQTNVSRNINSESFSDSRNNGIYQYGLISLLYRFSVFAGKNTMGTKDERSDSGFGGRRHW